MRQFIDVGREKILVREVEFEELMLTPHLDWTAKEVWVEYPKYGPCRVMEPVVLGFMHDYWLKFKECLQEGDKIFEYAHFPAPLFGNAGYVIARETNGKWDSAHWLVTTES